MMSLRRLHARAGGLCWLCGYRTLLVAHNTPEYRQTDRRLHASRDHIVPRKKGGTDCNANLHLAHKLCNEIRALPDSPDKRRRWRLWQEEIERLDAAGQLHPPRASS